MPKPDALTYETVEQAANELRASGAAPTVRLIRGKVGGSNTTILRHLNAWKAGQAAPRPAGRALPADLLSTLETALARVEAGARAEGQAQLVDVQNTLEDVSAENEELQARSAELVAQCNALASERDTLNGQRAEQAAELQALRETLAREQAAAEAARLDLARAQLRTEGSDARLAEQRDREMALQVEVGTAQAELARERDAKAAAERSAAVLVAQYQAEQAAHAATQTRVTELQRELKVIGAAAERSAAAEATTVELRATVGLLQDLLKRADSRPGPEAESTPGSSKASRPPKASG